MKYSARTFREALNDEIDYVRTFALPPQMLSSLLRGAGSKGLHPRDYVTRLLKRFVQTLPQAAAPASATAEAPTRRTASSLSGPNYRFVMRTATELDTDWNAALRQLLEYARTYGLTPQDAARLEKAASKRGVTMRDLATEVLLTAALEAHTAEPSPSP
jgi:hypothetical protein